MFPQIFEREKGMSDEGLRPIEKHAAGGGTNDVPGIHIEVPERDGYTYLVQSLESVLDSCREATKFLAGEWRGRSLGLAFHQFAHGSKKRLHKIRERPSTEIVGAGIEKVQSSAERRDLQFREALGHCFPRREHGALAKKTSLRLSRKPTAPLGSRSDDLWYEAREKTDESKRESIFPLVRVAHGLEPNRRPIGFKANQAERGAGI